MKPRRWAVIPQSVCTRIRILLQDHDQKTVSEMTGIAQSEISKIKARGFREAVIKAPRPMPDSFPTLVKRMSAGELVQHYKTSPRCVARWRRELDNPPPTKRGAHFRARPKKKRPVPADFEKRQAEMTIEEMKAHYSAGAATIKDWMRRISNPRPKWNGLNRPMEKAS